MARASGPPSTTAAGLDGFSEETVHAMGDRIYYLRGGDPDADRTVVLLHGGIIDAAHVTWRPVLESLAEDATVVAPHLPGYGPSPLPDARLSIARHVESTAALLEELGFPDPVVAGLSMGGGIGLGLGLTYPDRIGALVALDAMALGNDLASGPLTWLLAKVQVTNHMSVALMRRSRSYVRYGLEQLFADTNHVPERLVELVHAEVQRPGAGAAFRSLRASEVTWKGYRTNYADRLSDLTVPTRLVHGREDDVFPTHWSKRAADRIPDASLTVLEDCGHLPTWERADDVADVLRSAR